MNNLRQTIYSYLLMCGLSPVHKGFKLLIEAVILILQSDFKLKSLQSGVYSVLAKKYGIKPDTAQKDIKNAIDYAGLNGDLDFFSREFQHVMSPQGSVSTAAFLYSVANAMREQFAAAQCLL